MKRSILSLVIVLLGVGCASRARVGAFGDDAFYVARDHYRIGYAERRPDVVSADWVVDNFQNGPDGIGRVKWTRDYTRTVALDRDDDGRAERPLVIESYDLRLSHRGDGAVIWAQTTPVSSRIADRDLSVVAHDFVDRVGGGSYVDIDWSAALVRERRFGTVVRSEGPVSIDGVAGYQIMFDLVSIDQREVDAGHQGERITVVLVRPSAPWVHPPRAFGAGDGPPMLVTFGYASRTEHHDAHREEFEGLLGRVDFHETP